jgi:hypothetical protein
MSIAALLPLGTRPEEVPERLQIYQNQRYERSHKIQQGTRDSGADLSKGQQLDMRSFTAYNVGHDEWHSSKAALQNHLAISNPLQRWRSPVGFGPAPGPRQPLGMQHNDADVQKNREPTPETSSTYAMRFRTSRTYLQSLLPPGFSFVSPATVCQATLSCKTLNGMAWLGGKGYSLVMLELHGIVYVKRNGERVFGSFVPVVFENLADPVITGRDELGMPKLYSDMLFHTAAGDMEVTLAWGGTTFGKISFHGLSDAVVDNVVNEAAPKGPPGPPPPPEIGQFVWRYVPSVGNLGKPDAEYPVLLPKPNVDAQSAAKTHKFDQANFEFNAGDWKSLPTLHNITRVLSEIPNYGLVEATHVMATVVDDLSGAHRIE